MECRHWPLMKYEVEHDGQSETVTCTADVEDAHLAEVSGVYKGSTPGAAIGKAEREAKDGRLSPEVRRMLETRFQIHLPDKRVSVPGAGEGRMKTTRDAEENPPAEPVQATPPPAQDPPAADPPPAEASEAETERRVVAFTRTHFASAGLKAEDAPANMRALVSLAVDGRRYRDDLTAYTLAAGVRAYGDKFNRDMQEGILKRMSIEEIQAQAMLWGAKGDEIFPGGRQTVDEVEEPKQTPKRANVHGAYMT
jgi:hypothetical protein